MATAAGPGNPERPGRARTAGPYQPVAT